MHEMITYLAQDEILSPSKAHTHSLTKDRGVIKVGTAMGKIYGNSIVLNYL